MVIVLKNSKDQSQLEYLLSLLDEKGIAVQQTVGVSRTILGLVGDTAANDN